MLLKASERIVAERRNDCPFLRDATPQPRYKSGHPIDTALLGTSNPFYDH